ncbi:MAG: adenylate/guanylate cyclase domain-containing protein [Acidimicrobiia bacterium]
MNRRLRGFLRKGGASREEIDRAATEGWLTLLTLDRMVMPGEPRHTMDELAELTGTDVGMTVRIWRALGFPDLPPDTPAFRDTDVEALSAFLERLEAPVYPGWTLEHALPQVRVLSSALARIAEVESDDIVAGIQFARAEGRTDEEIAETMLERLRFEDLSGMLDHMHRLQMRTALWRKIAAGGSAVPGAVTLAVGFVDLVGYTSLSRRLDEEELRALLTRFDEVAYDTIAQRGGRMVKTIGDEVMFVADDSATAVDVSLALVERAEADGMLPEARAAIASGPLLARDGDYFGPVVNLASRLVTAARPGTLLVSGETRDELADDDRFEFRRVRLRRVPDVGRVALWNARRGHPSAGVP